MVRLSTIAAITSIASSFGLLLALLSHPSAAFVPPRALAAVRGEATLCRAQAPPLDVSNSSASTVPLEPSKSSKGRVLLVGAGPGDPDLLTVKALRCIEDPTALVISDRLVSSEVQELVRGELRIAKKAPGCAEAAQDQIYRWMREGFADGKCVVRLKIGDPFVFGRGGEEVLWCREQLGVEPEVVPGVSSAFAGPLSGMIPITHRGFANSVVMSTGYGRNGSAVPLLPYHPDATAVFLMAVGRLRELGEGLVNAGYPSTTPVAIVERATTPQQRTTRGTIETIADIAQARKVRAPAIVIVGIVCGVLADAELGQVAGSQAATSREGG